MTFVLPDWVTLGALLRARRLAAGLSQRKLAALLGCSHVTVCKYELGKIARVQRVVVDKWLEATAEGGAS